MKDKTRVIGVERWAALVSAPAGEYPEVWGACADERAIPASYRRRMRPLDRAMARCVLGVLMDVGEAEIVCASRYGNLDALVSLLRSLAEREPLSPMAFSLSVHNALAGMLGQIRGDRSAHTAVAAGRGTLASGLVESYCKLQVEPDCPVVLVFGDAPLPEIYAGFADEDASTCALALLLVVREATVPGLAVAPLSADQQVPTVDRSYSLVQQLVAHLNDGTAFGFRPPNGPAWHIGPA